MKRSSWKILVGLNPMASVFTRERLKEIRGRSGGGRDWNDSLIYKAISVDSLQYLKEVKKKMEFPLKLLEGLQPGQF